MFIYKYIDAMVYISVGMMQWGNFHTVIASCTRFIYIMTVNTCIHCRNYVVYIRQHGSAVYVGMVVVVCIL